MTWFKIIAAIFLCLLVVILALLRIFTDKTTLIGRIVWIAWIIMGIFATAAILVTLKR